MSPVKYYANFNFDHFGIVLIFSSGSGDHLTVIDLVRCLEDSEILQQEDVCSLITKISYSKEVAILPKETRSQSESGKQNKHATSTSKICKNKSSLIFMILYRIFLQI